MQVSRRAFLAALCLAALLPTLPVRAAEPPGPLQDRPLGLQQGVEVREWTYPSDGLRVKGRLYLPDQEGRRPVVIFNHDGISGISREHHLSSLRLARRGYVVFSPSYRGEDGSEGMVEIAKGEVRDVLNVLPLLSGLPQADPEKIAMVGASHGALISLLAASREPRIAGVVFAYGVADLHRWWDYLKARGKLGRDPITRRTYGDGPQARPESFRIRNAVGQLAGLKAPVLILQGLLDDTTPPEQAHLLKKALDRQGVPNRMRLYPDALHGFLVYAPFLSQDVTPQERAQAESAWGEVFQFLEEVFQGAARTSQTTM